MEQGSQDRNLPASERKLKKARDDGQVSRSQDLSHLAVLGAGAVAVLSLSPILFEQLKLSMVQQLSFDAETVRRTGTMVQRLGDASTIGTAGCVAFAAIVMTAAILAAVASGGWVSSLKPLMPDFSRLNPLSGFANLFPKETAGHGKDGADDCHSVCNCRPLPEVRYAGNGSDVAATVTRCDQPPHPVDDRRTGTDAARDSSGGHGRPAAANCSCTRIR